MDYVKKGGVDYVKEGGVNIEEGGVDSVKEGGVVHYTWPLFQCLDYTFCAEMFNY